MSTHIASSTRSFEICSAPFLHCREQRVRLQNIRRTASHARSKHRAAMEVKPAKREAKPTTASWLRNSAPSRAATRFAMHLRTPRPVISEPFGPIKTSRGPDFSRSETFLVVPGIKDCVAKPALDKQEQQKENIRTISAGFPKHPLSSKPTLARSGVTVTRGPLKTSSTVSLLPQHDENVPPGASG